MRRSIVILFMAALASRGVEGKNSVSALNLRNEKALKTDQVAKAGAITKKVLTKAKESNKGAAPLRKLRQGTVGAVVSLVKKSVTQNTKTKAKQVEPLDKKGRTLVTETGGNPPNQVKKDIVDKDKRAAIDELARRVSGDIAKKDKKTTGEAPVKRGSGDIASKQEPGIASRDKNTVDKKKTTGDKTPPVDEQRKGDNQNKKTDGNKAPGDDKNKGGNGNDKKKEDGGNNDKKKESGGNNKGNDKNKEDNKKEDNKKEDNKTPGQGGSDGDDPKWTDFLQPCKYLEEQFDNAVECQIDFLQPFLSERQIKFRVFTVEPVCAIGDDLVCVKPGFEGTIDFDNHIVSETISFLDVRVGNILFGDFAISGSLCFDHDPDGANATSWTDVAVPKFCDCAVTIGSLQCAQCGPCDEGGFAFDCTNLIPHLKVGEDNCAMIDTITTLKPSGEKIKSAVPDFLMNLVPDANED
jgi:hypothetical protein